MGEVYRARDPERMARFQREAELPANIMIAPEGGVELLDFGPAKAFWNQREPSASPEKSPTLALGATEVGVNPRNLQSKTTRWCCS